MKRILLAVFVLVLLARWAGASISTYNFESLSPVGGAIIGQDGWADFSGSNISPVLGSNVGVNNTKFLQGANGSNASRVNGGGFNYGVDFTDTTWGIEVDVSWLRGNKYWGVGNDVDVSGNISESASEFPGYLFTGGGDIEIKVGAGNSYVVSSSIAGIGNFDDWVRVQTVFDWTQGTYGRVTVFTKNLTAGDLVFTPVPGLQNVDVAGSNWAAWKSNAVSQPSRNGIWVRYDEAGNLLDNFSVGHVPEPASLALLGIGVIFLSRRRQS